ncbi:MAG: Y4yA family PLP-dependent enzyme [Planctomycetaceae bacterium]
MSRKSVRQQETKPEKLSAELESVRSHCRGVLPLTGRLEPWMVRLLKSDQFPSLLNQFGSPLNVQHDRPFRRNIARFYQVAEDHQLNFDLFFARKANKCLRYLDVVREIGSGVDTASEVEIQQTLDRGISGDRIICTAAVKSPQLLGLCIDHGITIAIDNADELRIASYIASQKKKVAPIAIRVGEFQHAGGRLETRFGFPVEMLRSHFHQLFHQKEVGEYLQLIGVHFHLNGYDLEERVSAIRELLPLIDHWRTEGHPIRFLDIGGGFPMSYLEEEVQWASFWLQHSRALLGHRSPVTWNNHGLGLTVGGNQIYGRRNSYPYWQSPVQHDWFDDLLKSPCGSTHVAEAIRKRNLELRCEPGRSLLDGCGMTIAHVLFRKQRTNGDWLIGLGMNHTQCKTSSDDFMVDPLLIKTQPDEPPEAKSRRNPGMEGYLVGAYCTETELLSLRKLSFPQGVSVGDHIVFLNTAGYLMHFRESRSHQFPLAKNVFVDESRKTVTLDDIDQQP